ncbi:MAG: nuclear transport factor 2 family protein [Acidimicrobiales bacterium]
MTGRWFRTCFTADCRADYGGDRSLGRRRRDHGVHGVGPRAVRPHAAPAHEHGRRGGGRPGHRPHLRRRRADAGRGREAINSAGHYDDRLVRTDDGWRIAERRYTTVVPPF